MTIFHGQTSLAVGATLMVKLHGRYNSARIAPIPGAERRGGGEEEGGGWRMELFLFALSHTPFPKFVLQPIIFAFKA